MRRANHPGGNVSARRRATLSDVARRAGVSPVTVSRAIRHPEMVSEDLRRRIDEAVRSLNYIPNNLASALASTRTHIVGVIVPSLTNGVFDDYLGAIQDVLNPAGFEVLVLNVRYSEIEEEKAIAALLGYHPEAMIVAGTDQTERSRELLRNAGVPVVQTMDVTDDPIDLNIGLDHRAAGAAAVRYLYELGHRKIAHLTARADPRARRRHAGYQQQMDEYGLPTAGLVGASPRPSDVAMGAELFSAVIENAPDVTAVFTCNDDLALGTLFECQRRGIRVPDDVAIIGFNDLDYAVASVPPLSSVSTERRKMGTWAAEAIIEIIRGTGRRSLQTSIDVGFSIKRRGSTASKRTGPARRSTRRLRSGA
ncbi:MAG TPA: LacI family DNA-binding transcriptional regulator [Devosia sp.]|nr:LacI family DNA-binding transcriptional regulator [Devosia sp.]